MQTILDLFTEFFTKSIDVRFLDDNEFKNYTIIKEWFEQAFNRLESIDNAKPSEAMECLRQIGVIETYHRGDGTLLKDSIMFKPEYDTIKQALLKTQEPKHYLKWEDLEFKEETTYEKVKMGEHIYELKYWKYKDSYKDFMGNDIYYYKQFVFLRGHQIECMELFNDLHLEVLK